MTEKKKQRAIKKEKAKHMHKAGQTTRTIGDMLGVSHVTVMRWLRGE